MMEQKKNRENGAWKGLRYLKERGVKEFAAHAAEKVRDQRFDYQRWLRQQQITSVQAGYQKKLRFSRMPKIYCLQADIPSAEEGQESDALLQATLRSVNASTYPKVSVTGALNSQISDEDFLTWIRPGDLIERHAFFEMVQALQDGADAVYSDEDAYVERDGDIVHLDPLFKPDYNPDYLRSVNYIGSLLLVRIGIIRSIYRQGEKAFVPSARKFEDPAYCYDYTLRCLERASIQGGVRHVPKVLYHARKTDGETGGAVPGICVYDAQKMEEMRRVLQRDLTERGCSAEVEDGPVPGTFHIAYEIKENPLVSIVIPNKDNASVLENCVLSIRSRSTWKNYEIIVVENNSKQRQTLELYKSLEESGAAHIIRYPHAFHYSRVINEGVRKAKGDYLILMNNDVTVRTPDWIERLLAQACRKEVGAVGPKLLYPDGRVQSAGIVTGLMGYAGSMMVEEDGDDPGYMGRAVLTQDMSAVTGACMMVRRSAFQEAGGYPDEFSVALGDVDFCLSLKDLGYRVVFEPAAVMIHHESLTRGAEDSREKKKRFASEQAAFRKKRARILKDGDPSYNPNLSRRRCDWSQQT